MEHDCKKVQAEEYVIRVVESTNFYTHLQFSLLASPWLPLPLGTILWSALNIIFLACKSLGLLAILIYFVVLAVCIDSVHFVYSVFILLCLVVMSPLVFLSLCLVKSFAAVIDRIRLLISRNCCIMPRRAPGQALAHNILTAGRSLTPPPQTPPAEEQTTAARLCGWFGDYWKDTCIRNLVNDLKLGSIPYWRVTLGKLCREIVPTDDAVVI